MNKISVSMFFVAFSLVWGVQAQKTGGKAIASTETVKSLKANGVPDSLIKPILGQVNFRMIGPSTTSGRIVDIAVNPSTNLNITSLRLTAASGKPPTEEPPTSPSSIATARKASVASPWIPKTPTSFGWEPVKTTTNAVWATETAFIAVSMAENPSKTWASNSQSTSG